MASVLRRSMACAIFLVVASSAAAQQTCTYDGQRYPEGARIGDLKCENGQWVVVE